MVYKGEIIIAHDPDIRDMYCCEVVRGDEENKRNLLCRVLYMVNYPIQHAILDGSVPNENPPIPKDAVCRLAFVRRVLTQDASYRGYEDSVKRCFEEYAKRRRYLRESIKDTPPALRHGVACPDEREMEILERHERGEYRGKRSIINH